MFEMYKYNELDLTRKQQEFFHIGMKEVAKFLDKKNVTILSGEDYIVKKTIYDMCIGSVINLNKTIYFSMGDPRYNITRSLSSLIDNNDYFCNLYIFDHIYNPTEIYNLILDIDRELNGIDFIIVNYRRYNKKLYYGLSALAQLLNINIIVSYTDNNQGRDVSEFNMLDKMIYVNNDGSFKFININEC